MRKPVIFISALVLFLIIILMLAITRLDRTSYDQSAAYQDFQNELEKLETSLVMEADSSILKVGWSKENLTPSGSYPLAGYGARDPMKAQGVRDSAFVRTVIFQQGSKKVALVSADLLIIHPEVSLAVYGQLPESWSSENIFFTATHTHSGPGGWAPGLVGSLFAGDYDKETVQWMATQIVNSIREAENNLQAGSVGYGNFHAGSLIQNRMITEGPEDSLFHVLSLKSGANNGIFGVFGAHATCYTHQFRQLSGDYPSRLLRNLEKDSSIQFAAFGAGAMGSMGPDANDARGESCANTLAQQLTDQLNLYFQMSRYTDSIQHLASFHVPLLLPEPQVKVSQNLAIRPWLFRKFFGDYQSYISVAVLGKTVLIGLPGDFSGELTRPLYEKAQSLGLNLVITSFNGGYIGYVVRDDRYDLNNYESRTMSWYGPGMGSYISDAISNVLDIIDEKLN